jgi:peptidoglycan/xylan/chitin deacetylase (PgdA/CDA1 family)
MPERDFVGYGRHAPRVTWPEGARVAVSVQVNYEAGAEYTFEEDGRNEGAGEWITGMGNAVADRSTQSVYEYETRAGFWRVARLLDEHQVPATVNACALALERNPEVAGYLREAPHEVCCHGWRWEELWELDRDEEREHLQRAVRSIEETCGERPRGWCSRLMASSNTRELLVEEGGFLYDSDALNDDLPYFVDVGGRDHVVIPLSFTYNDGRFILSGDDPGSFLNYLRMGFDELWREGATHPKLMTIALHPRWIGQAARTAALRAFLEHALAKSDVWFARRIDIAEWWIAHHHEFAK